MGDPPELLSERALRDRAADLGAPVSGEQFRNYRKWGLLPEPIEGRWPRDVAETLVCIRQAEVDARPLERRVVLLWTGWRGHPPIRAPFSKLREAMTALVSGPSIKAPVRKMKRIEVALSAWVAREVTASGEDSLLGTWRSSLEETPFRPPSPEEWRAILDSPDLSDEHFAEVVAWRLYLASLLRGVSVGSPHDLASIPIEELFVLLTIRELARERVEVTARSQPK